MRTKDRRLDNINRQVRTSIIGALRDGVSRSTYFSMIELLSNTGNQDIIQHVMIRDDQYYISSRVADRL